MLLFCDGFDHYTNLTDKWPDGQASTVGAWGRFSTNGWRQGEAGGRYITKTLGANYTELILGTAMMVASGGPLFSFQDLSASETQITARYTGSGNITIYRGYSTASPLVSTGAGVVDGNYHYFEWRVVFDNTTGEVELRMDEEVIASVTGVDTCFSANESADAILLGDAGASGTFVNRYDDVYCIDTTDSGVPGAPNDTFLGDVRVETLFPSGNGNSSQWVGSDANSTDNYLLVDEVTSDDDTTYVESATAGNKDTYAFDDLDAALGSVYGVQLLPLAKKTDVGTRTIKSITRLSTVEEDGPDQTLSTSYVYKRDIREADPNGDMWTIANVNAAEFGQKVFS